MTTLSHNLVLTNISFTCYYTVPDVRHWCCVMLLSMISLLVSSLSYPVSVSAWYCQVFDTEISAPSSSVQEHEFFMRRHYLFPSLRWLIFLSLASSQPLSFLTFSNGMVTSMLATFLQASSIAISSARRDSSRLGTAWLFLMVVEEVARNTFTSLPRMSLWRFVMNKKFGLQWHTTCCRVSLRHIATSAIFPVSVAWLMAAIKWEAVWSCTVNEAPVHKVHEVANPQEVVWRACGAGVLKHFTLVCLG